MRQAIWVLAWPVLCESVLNAMVGLVDTGLAARVSLEAAEAVSAAAYVLWFMGLIAMAIGVGATALISRSVGAGRPAVARAALGQALILAVVAGPLAGGLLALSAPHAARLLSLDEGATAAFVGYLYALSFGVPGLTVLAAGNACARGAGDTQGPLWTMVVVNVVNFFASVLLAQGLGLGVVGIGLGTTVAQTVGAAMIVGLLLRGKAGVELRRRWLRWHPVTAYRLVRLSIPSFVETLGMWAVNFAGILMVAWMSAAAAAGGAGSAAGAASAESVGSLVRGSKGLLGAHFIAIRIEAVSFLPGFAMGIAAGSLTGQYLGARAPELARRGALACAGVAAAMMGTCGLVLVFFGRPLVGLVSPQPEHLEVTPRVLFITGLVQVPFALAIVLRSAMQGAGDTKMMMRLTWISQWGLRLPLAYALSGVDVPRPGWMGGGVIENPFPFDLGLVGLWLGLCLELVVRMSLYGARFVHGGWMKARV
jgi:Na+-driven multidrug efflux pump